MNAVVPLHSVTPMPEPGTDLVPDGWCECAVIPWADEQYEEAVIAQASAQLAGLAAAYATLGADTLELTKARRYLEVRWGELLGDGAAVKTGPGHNASHAGEALGRNDRHRFRQMAARKDEVLGLMRTATDADQQARDFTTTGTFTPDPEGWMS